MQPNQVQITAAITAELTRQGLEHISLRQCNAIITAADIICESFELEPAPNYRLLKWFAFGTTEASSRYMAYILFPQDAPKVEYAHPYDIGDFKRCLSLVEGVPNAKSKLHLLKEKSSHWAGICQCWDDWAVRIKEGDSTVEEEIRYIIKLHDALET